VLAMALQRHFPAYYRYFKTTEFTYSGRTYKTHNRVLLKYPGCDGLKTGFINASGFNLVSSVHRNGRHLIGVVMGGSSGASRDARMMELMDRALGIRGQPLSATNDNTQVKPTIVASNTPALATPPAIRKELVAANTMARPGQRLIPVNGGQLALAKPNRATANASDAPSVSASMLATAIARPSQRIADNGWGIQVGAYDDAAQASSAAEIARTKLPQAIAQNAIAFPQASSGVYRARLKGLNEEQARNACRSLVQQNAACFVVQVN
jgi:D-alanyl-D-alanine carboxypeptidase